VAAVGMVGCSDVHQRLLAQLTKFAPTDAEILITGATGTGKELYAGFVHQQSLRSKAAFVPVNCGAIPDQLLENELFGHVGGAFTGAQPRTDGLVATAEGGTLFLDEVDTLSLPCQVKLLRFIQEKEYRRLGETRLRRANVRFIAATNTDLLTAVKSGRFREDLFFRLRVIPIEIPPLWKRKADIRPLLDQYVAYYAELYKVTPITLDAGALERIDSYSWPGNIRELENCVQYLTCLQFDHAVQAEDLPLLNLEEEQDQTPAEVGSGLSFQKAKRELVTLFEREYLEEALRRSGGNIAEAARASGKARRAFFELMRKHGIRAVSAGLPVQPAQADDSGGDAASGHEEPEKPSALPFERKAKAS
jgi:two-component system, NtrC family, response regulator GlrR